MCTLEEYTADRQRFEDELMDRAETRKERWDRRGWGSGSPNIWECVLAVWYDVYQYETDSVLHEMILVDIFYYIVRICQKMDINLEEAFYEKMKKNIIKHPKPN